MATVLKIALVALFCLVNGSSASARDISAFAVSPVMTVVIDPGHGGDDTGAKGPSGTDEKDITLSIALKLAGELRERLGAMVLLTRDTDVFIPLEDRTAFANTNRADLFISIHVNAAANRDARGIETFFLSMDSTDEDSRRLAAFENSVGQSAEDASFEGGDLREILLDMASTSSHHESSRLAEAVHMSMLGATGREGRGIKQAPFTVLVGATMPAILVEVGFISNPSEGKLLASKKEQALAASAIADGVASFRDLTARRSFIEVSGTQAER